MRAVNISIGHNNNFVVTQLACVKFIAYSAAESRYYRLDFAVCEHFIHVCFFDIQNFTPERQNGLKFSVPSLLCAASCAVSFYYIKLCILSFL